MLYRAIGNTGLMASEIGLGGEYLEGRGADEVKAVIDAAENRGINIIDIFMPQPLVRSHIGSALRGRREKFMIQGHLCAVCSDDGQYERSRELEKTIFYFEDLLRRLETDYIDIGMVHYIDTEEDFDAVFQNGIIDYAKRLREQGVIRHLGFSSHNPVIAMRAVETGLFEVMLFSINPAYDLESSDAGIFDLMEFKGLAQDGWTADPARQQLYAACAQRGIGITVMKALGAGSLLRAESSPFGKAMTVVQCCHYCLTRPSVVSVLAGYKTVEELCEAVAYCSASDEEKDYSHIYEGNHSIRMTGRCMYCNHCLPCPVGIDIASVTKFLDLARMEPQVPQTVREHYRALGANGSDCIECGNCEPNCPFGVAIRENMRAAREIFA